MHTKFKAHLLLGGLFLMLSSCNSSKKIVSPIQLNYKDYEARWSDIPFLIDFIPQDQLETDSYNFIAGESYSSMSEVVDFYKKEMERLGWVMSACFYKNGYKLIFEKPYKM
jgi:hypothetical protein